MCALGQKEPAFFWVDTEGYIHPIKAGLREDGIIALEVTTKNARTELGAGQLAQYWEGELKIFD